jgi:hypothetical protein
VFFGVVLCISLVQHPAAIETGSDFAARFFTPMYGRAAILQTSLASVGCVAAIAAWFTDSARLWLAAALLLGSAVPFSLIVVKPVNDALLHGGDRSASELVALLVRWGYLRWARTGVPVASLSYRALRAGALAPRPKTRAARYRASCVRGRGSQDLMRGGAAMGRVVNPFR